MRLLQLLTLPWIKINNNDMYNLIKMEQRIKSQKNMKYENQNAKF